jgi:hypothetical protein
MKASQLHSVPSALRSLSHNEPFLTVFIASIFLSSLVHRFPESARFPFQSDSLTLRSYEIFYALFFIPICPLLHEITLPPSLNLIRNRLFTQLCLSPLAIMLLSDIFVAIRDHAAEFSSLDEMYPCYDDHIQLIDSIRHSMKTQPLFYKMKCEHKLSHSKNISDPIMTLILTVYSRLFPTTTLPNDSRVYPDFDIRSDLPLAIQVKDIIFNAFDDDSISFDHPSVLSRQFSTLASLSKASRFELTQRESSPDFSTTPIVNEVQRSPIPILHSTRLKSVTLSGITTPSSSTSTDLYLPVFNLQTQSQIPFFDTFEHPFSDINQYNKDDLVPLPFLPIDSDPLTILSNANLVANMKRELHVLMLQRDTLTDATIAASHPISLIVHLRRLINTGYFPLNPRSPVQLRIRALSPSLYTYFFNEVEPPSYAYLATIIPYLPPSLFCANENQLSNALWLLFLVSTPSLDPQTHELILSVYWPTILSSIDLRRVYIKPGRIYEIVPDPVSVIDKMKTQLIRSIDSDYPEPLRSSMLLKFTPVIQRNADLRHVKLSHRTTLLRLPPRFTLSNIDLQVATTLHACFYPADDIPRSSSPSFRASSPENDEQL